MSKIEGNANYAVVANSVELASEAIALYVRKNGIKKLFGEHVNRQLIADTVANRIASNIRIQHVVDSVKQ